MKRYATLISAWSSTSRFRTAAWTETSSAGGRLVADDELGVAYESARDGDPPLEAAGELHGLLRERSLGLPYARLESSAAAARPRSGHTRELAQERSSIIRTDDGGWAPSRGSGRRSEARSLREFASGQTRAQHAPIEQPARRRGTIPRAPARALSSHSGLADEPERLPGPDDADHRRAREPRGPPA